MSFSFDRIAQYSVRPYEGKLPPLGSQEIMFSFAPKNLGNFSSTITLSLADGIRTIPIHVQGIASSFGDKPTLVGGTDKLPVDFKYAKQTMLFIVP